MTVYLIGLGTKIGAGQLVRDVEEVLADVLGAADTDSQGYQQLLHTSRCFAIRWRWLDVEWS